MKRWLLFFIVVIFVFGCAKEKVVLNELQVAACDAASDNNNCGRLEDLGIVTANDCCFALGKCCDTTLITGHAALSDVQATVCESASANNKCDEVAELGLVTKEECCSESNLCCSASSISLEEFKSVLIDAIKDYFSSNPTLTTAELKDLIVAYLSTPGENVDLLGKGEYSGENLNDIYNKAKTISPSCTDECSPSGAKQCYNTNSYQTCGNYDDDSCLEWSTAANCPSNQTCSNGQCASPTQNCTGTCKKSPCSSYQSCSSASGSCTTGYCCTGSCTSVTPPATACVSDADCFKCGYNCYGREYWNKYFGPNTQCYPENIVFDCKCVNSQCKPVSSKPSCNQIFHKAAVFDDATTALYAPNSIFVSGNYAYVTSCAVGETCGVEVLDVSDPVHPKHAGKLVDDANILLDVPEAIYVSGNYAYVLSRGAAYLQSGLEILDISNPAQPKHVSKLVDDSTTLLDRADSVFVSGNYAYVANSFEHGIEVLDISNPSQPKHAGKIVDDASTLLFSPKDIFVSGKYAYVANGVEYGLAGDVETLGGVEVLDVSNPVQPKHVSKIATNVSDPKEVTAMADPREIFVSGNYAYVTSYNNAAIEILDISNPASPKHVTKIVDNIYSYNVSNAFYHPIGIPESVFVSGNYVYFTSAGTEEYGSGVNVFDISTPSQPKFICSVSDNTATALGYPVSVFVSGNYVYVASLIEQDIRKGGVEILGTSLLK